MARIKKMASGGKSSLGMKSVKAGYDSNPSVTRADIIVAAKKKAKGGTSIKPKSPSVANVSKRLGSRLKNGGSLSPAASNVSKRLASPFKKKARGGATLSPSKKSTSNRLASNLKMKDGGKASMKKAMGGYKMMKMGGKCRGGCY